MSDATEIGCTRAGIDEAGYGPLLGPLLVGLAAFDLADERTLWDVLADAVSRSRTAKDKVVVCDSKVLNQGVRGLAALEATALSFIAWDLGFIPETLGEWIGSSAIASTRDRLASPPPPPAEVAREYPWYRNGLSAITLPLATERSRIEDRVARLESAAARAGVSLAALRVRPVFEDEFNRSVAERGSKATVLFDANVDLLRELAPGSRAQLRVTCDRHGGRSSYRGHLADAFATSDVRTLSEGRSASRYCVGFGDRAMEIEYVTGGEQVSFEVALASILAKYTRELFMEAMNRHFVERVPELAPTAGYWVDGQRYIATLLARGAIDEATRDRLLRHR